jgi:hypothetical protein
MAVVDCAIAVGSAVGLEGGAALIGGGAIMGAGAGALYSGVTGDGNILNSALNGALLGGGAGALGAAAGLGATSAAAPTVASALPGVGVGGAAPVATGGVAAYDAGLAGTAGTAVSPAATVLPSVSAAAPVGYGGNGIESLNAMNGGNWWAEPGAVSNAASDSAMYNTPAVDYNAVAVDKAASDPSFWDSSMGTAAKWGLGATALGAMMNKDNKKYGTISNPASNPLPYKSNFGTYQPLDTSVMRQMGTPSGPYTGTPYGAPGYTGSKVGYAAGGIADANPVQNPSIGSVEQMSRDNAVGQNQMFPQAAINSPAFSSATNTPMGTNMIAPAGDTNVDPYSGAERFADGGLLEQIAMQPVNQLQAAVNNPEQAMIGANTPFETNMWNSALGTHYTPLTNMYGTPTDAAVAGNVSQGGKPRYAAGGDVQTTYNPFTHLFSADAPQDTGGNTALAQAVYDPTMHRFSSVAPQPQIDGGAFGFPDGVYAGSGMAAGGIAGHSNLGGYAAGGNPRLLKGPGDGMSDNIPATIGDKQPARLADGEFVVPADVVSHLGNGSTDAGAKHLYSMMDKVRAARTGNKKQGKQIKADKFLPK